MYFIHILKIRVDYDGLAEILLPIVVDRLQDNPVFFQRHCSSIGWLNMDACSWSAIVQ